MQLHTCVPFSQLPSDIPWSLNVTWQPGPQVHVHPDQSRRLNGQPPVGSLLSELMNCMHIAWYNFSPFVRVFSRFDIIFFLRPFS